MKHLSYLLFLSFLLLSSCQSIKEKFEEPKETKYSLKLKGEDKTIEKEEAINIAKSENSKAHKVDLNFKKRSKRPSLVKDIASITPFIEKQKGKAWMDTKISFKLDVDSLELRPIIKLFSQKISSTLSISLILK